jgi:hypothetical protein
MDTFLLMLFLGLMIIAGVALGIQWSHKRRLNKVRHNEFWDRIHNK